MWRGVLVVASTLVSCKDLTGKLSSGNSTNMSVDFTVLMLTTEREDWLRICDADPA